MSVICLSRKINAKVCSLLPLRNKLKASAAAASSKRISKQRKSEAEEVHTFIICKFRCLGLLLVVSDRTRRSRSRKRKKRPQLMHKLVHLFALRRNHRVSYFIFLAFIIYYLFLYLFIYLFKIFFSCLFIIYHLFIDYFLFFTFHLYLCMYYFLFISSFTYGLIYLFTCLFIY